MTTDPVIEYVTALQQRMAILADAPTSPLDTSDLEAALRDAAPMVAEAAIAEARQVLDGVASQMAAGVERGSDLQMLARSATLRLRSVLTAAATATVTPNVTTQLNNAETALTKARQDHAMALAKLEQAVGDLDVDAVLALRPDVEVRLPGLIDAAELAVLDARLAVHRDATASTSSRAASTAADVQAARDVVTEAEARLATANDHLDHAATIDQIVRGAVAAEAATGHRLEQARIDLADRINTATQARFRHLAGLPEPLDVVEPAEPTDRIYDPLTQKSTYQADDGFTYHPDMRAGGIYAGIDWANVTGADEQIEVDA